MPKCQLQLHTADSDHKAALLSRMRAKLAAQLGGVHIGQAPCLSLWGLDGALMA